MVSNKSIAKDKERTLNQQLGERLRFFRMLKGFTQADLAAHVGVSFQQVQKWERGQNRLSTARLMMLCELFQINLSDFIQSQEDHNTIPTLTKAEVQLLTAYRALEPHKQLYLNTAIKAFI